MKLIKRSILGVFFVCLTGLIMLYTAAFFDKLSLDEQRKNITIYDTNGDRIYESNYKKNMQWTSIEDIPDMVQNAFVSVEDKRFNSHVGFDPIRITKAMFNNLKSGGVVEGGSTITQQYAKNLFLTNEQTWKRKVQELYYSARLEMQYSKAEILEGYLNTVYFGHGIYGVSAAAQYFFDKDLSQLSIAQIAMLVGIPNGPSIYSPFLHPDNAIKRQHLILDVLYNNEAISEQEKQEAYAEPLTLSSQETKASNGMEQYYIDAVLSELNTMHVDLNQEIHVYTSYDPSVQLALFQAVKQHTSNDDELEVAGIVVQPFTGNVLALSGGKDYTISQYNRATQSQRQIASTVKPLLYYCALQQGFTPSTQFLSQITTFKLNNDDEYTPSNYDNKYPNRKISMINAIAMSDNIYAVKTHLFLGVDTLHQALLDFGINQSIANPSEALGSVNMSITQLSSIYNTFASEGLYTTPSFIQRIENKEEVLYEHESDPKRLLKRDETLVLSQMMTSTYDIRNKTVNFPSMYASAPDVKVAVKSGTSDWDSLVMGYNPEYTVGVWSGFDDNRTLDKAYYGVSKGIFKDTFDALYQSKEEVWYQPSNNIEIHKVDPITGEANTSGSEYWYIKGTFGQQSVGE